MRFLLPTIASAALLCGGVVSVAAHGASVPGVRAVLTGYQDVRSVWIGRPCSPPAHAKPAAALTADPISLSYQGTGMPGHM
jgi:hypothetical protein